MRTAVIFNLVTKEIKGIIRVSQDSDLPLNVKASEGHIEIPFTHAVCLEQNCWEIKENQGKAELVRRPQATIDAEQAIEGARREVTQKREIARPDLFFELLIEYVNEVRQKLNLPTLTLTELKAKMEERIKEVN